MEVHGPQNAGGVTNGPIDTDFGKFTRDFVAPVEPNECSHNPADGNADIDVLAGLGATVEATRVAVAHVLRISGDAISIQIPWRPTATVDPTWHVIPPFRTFTVG